jgi:hypothetical protein
MSMSAYIGAYLEYVPGSSIPSVGTMKDIFIKYVQDNPEKGDEPATVTLAVIAIKNGNMKYIKIESSSK